MKIHFSIFDIFNKITKKYYNDNHFRKRNKVKYFKEIIKFYNNSIYWRRYDSSNIISRRTPNNKNNDYIKKGIYTQMYNVVLKQYFKATSYTLKILSVSTSFIPNKQCGNLPRNKCYKSKKRNKIINYRR